MKLQRLQLAGLLMACAALSALVAGCKKNRQEDVKKVTADSTVAIHVVTITVNPESFEDWGVYSADLRGVEDAVLTAPMMGGGRVNQVSEVGQTVAKDQALCDIESERYQAGSLQAKAALDLAKGEMDRTKNNVDNGYIGKAMLDKTELDYQTARAASLQAERAYDDSRCLAPFAGVLVSRFVDRYQSVAPGAPTVRVVDISRLEAVVSIPESEAADYREGQKAEFQLLQGGGEPVIGHIKGLDRAVESRNRTVMARIELSNPGNRLQPGMVGKTRILRKLYDNALVVPSQAVLRLQDGTSLMRVDAENLAHKVAVTLGPSQGDSVVILSGISPGDRIITVGAFEVTEDTRVEF